MARKKLTRLVSSLLQGLVLKPGICFMVVCLLGNLKAQTTILDKLKTIKKIVVAEEIGWGYKLLRSRGEQLNFKQNCPRQWTTKVFKNCGGWGNWPGKWNNFKQNCLRKWTRKVMVRIEQIENKCKKDKIFFLEKSWWRLGYPKACSWVGWCKSSFKDCL